MVRSLKGGHAKEIIEQDKGRSPIVGNWLTYVHQVLAHNEPELREAGRDREAQAVGRRQEASGFLHQIAQGARKAVRHFLHEHPPSATSWLEPDTINLGGRFLMTQEAAHAPKVANDSHEHVILQGSNRTRHARVYLAGF